MKLETLLLSSLLTFTVACSSGPSDKIIGKWRPANIFGQSTEFKSDGTYIVGGKVYKWRKLDDNRIIVTLEEGKEFIKNVKLENGDQTLTLYIGEKPTELDQKLKR